MTDPPPASPVAVGPAAAGPGAGRVAPRRAVAGVVPVGPYGVGRAGLVRLAVLGALLGLTAWNFTRDDALREALEARRQNDTPVMLRRALDRLTRSPTDLEATRLAAQGLSWLIYPDQAEPYYRALGRRGALTLEDRNARALGLNRANRRDDAVEAYRAILHDYPDDPMALQRLAAVHWGRRDTDGALDAARRLAATPTGGVAGHTIMAEVYYDLKQHDLAIPHFRKVVALDPELRRLTQPRVIFWQQYGDALLRKGLSAEARAALAGAVARESTPVLLDLYGQACQDEGDSAEAQRLWLKSAEADPARVTPWVLLGRLALQARRYDDAIAYLTRANDLTPDLYGVLRMLAAAHRSLGQLDDFRRVQARADRFRPKDAGDNGMGSVSTPQPLGTPHEP